MKLLDVMAEIGTQLGTIDGLRVYDYPIDRVTPPAAIIAYPDDITYDATYGRGMDRMTLPVLVVVGKANDRAARDNLVPYANSAGLRSVKQAVENGSYTALHTVRVMSATFDVVRIADIDLAAVQFDLDIVGSGTE